MLIVHLTESRRLMVQSLRLTATERGVSGFASIASGFRLRDAGAVPYEMPAARSAESVSKKSI